MRKRTPDILAAPRLWIEEGETRAGAIAEVAPLLHVFKTYTFAVPPAWENRVAIGQRVTIPMGRRGRLAPGFVVNIDRGPWEDTLRPLHGVIDTDSFLTPHLVALGREIAEHYACPLGATLKAMTPESVRRERGLARRRYAAMTVPLDQILANQTRISAAGRRVLERLASAGESMLVDTLLKETGASPAVLKTLRVKGWITIETRREERVPSDGLRAGPSQGSSEVSEPQAPLRADLTKTSSTAAHGVNSSRFEPPFELNDDQQAALNAIDESLHPSRFLAHLLYGVSGSGKTEIYIRAMRRVIESGGQAILLIPEIVLTTQLTGRVATRLPGVAVCHSAMTETQRAAIWRRAASGDAKVIVGTRSAVFAPCPNLGLICVDEEQEPSFKNQQAPRYHVRDAAILRAKLLNIPIVLGSATPALETWRNSDHRPEYRRLTLPRRVRELPMPRVRLIPMLDEQAQAKRPVLLSRVLVEEVSGALERREQAMLLINRRGYAHRIVCPRCGLRLTCPNCNAGMVVHLEAGESICHLCRHRCATPTRCPQVGCGAPLTPVGAGSQKVEREIQSWFPSARVARVDSDTMTHRSRYQALIDDFESGRIDLIVGTQMIAKGLDFPNVSLVGVIDADGGSGVADFRFQERLFQLITQVAGRAGRANQQGTVVVQAMTPELPALRFALDHDFPGFAAAELAVRERVGLPPFRRIARIVLSHSREEIARRESTALTERVRELIDRLGLPQADVLGPNPCSWARIRNRYRYDLMIRTLTANELRALLRRANESSALRSKAESTVVDVDPVSMS